MNTKIQIEASILLRLQKVWAYWTAPEHITKWNFAAPEWHCPKATNELRVGGKYFARMEAKDGSFAFDLWGGESETDPFYAKVIANGRKENRTGVMLGLGSAYRCLGEYQKSLKIFAQTVKECPENRSLKVFRARRFYCDKPSEIWK